MSGGITNTQTYKSIFKDVYQMAWYQDAIYPALAYEKFYNKLEKGQTIKWTYTTDPRVRSLDTDGGFSTKGRTNADDTLTIDTFPSVSDRVPFPEEALDHRNTYKKWAEDQAASYLWKMDADVLGAAYAAAASTLTGSDIGSSGALQPTESNISQIFTGAFTKLALQGVLKRGFSNTKRYTNDRKQDYGSRMPIAIVSPELYAKGLGVYSLKNTSTGDDILRSSYLGYILGFNTFISNFLPFSVNYVVTAGNATNGDTFVLLYGMTDPETGVSEALTFTLVTGTPSNAGEIKIGNTATDTATNIKNSLNAPFTSVSGTYYAFTADSLSSLQENLLRFTSASSSGATVTIKILGHGRVPYTDTAAAEGFLDTSAVVHNIFGTSQAVALAETYLPKSVVTPDNGVISVAGGGYVAKDILTYGVYGKKVFHYQKRMIVDVQVLASTLGTPNVRMN